MPFDTAFHAPLPPSLPPPLACIHCGRRLDSLSDSVSPSLCLSVSCLCVLHARCFGAVRQNIPPILRCPRSFFWIIVRLCYLNSCDYLKSFHDFAVRFYPPHSSALCNTSHVDTEWIAEALGGKDDICSAVGETIVIDRQTTTTSLRRWRRRNSISPHTPTTPRSFRSDESQSRVS